MHTPTPRPTNPSTLNGSLIMRTENTYPCVVGHRIVELTAAQRDALEWRSMTPEQKIEVLLGRIERLERALEAQPRAS